MAEELSIQQLRSLVDSPAVNRAAEAQLTTPAQAGAQPGDAPSFVETLRSAIAEVNDLKLEAAKATEDLATGQTTDIQGTILAIEKADMSFKLMMEMRNKIVAAYQEVMRTQV